MKKRWLCWVVWGVVLLTIHGAGHAAEKYPTRAIELVAPTRPGGSSDVVARLYNDVLSKNLKVPIIMVNRAGGAGSSGTIYVINAKKDGYTLLAEPGTPLVIVPAVNKEVTYDPVKDLTPLGYLGSIASAFAVKGDSPFKTLGEMMDYARQNPGKIRNGVGGMGTESQFNMEVVSLKAKVNLTTVPFQGGAEAMTALLGGHVDISCNTLAVLGPQIAAGKLRALAVTAKTRVPELPNIPTTAELGFPDASFEVWFGAFAPAGVPQSAVQVLVPAVEKTFKSPEVAERAKKIGLTMRYMGPAELSKFLEEAIRTAKKVAQDANIGPVGH
jgi:tripartite-type tricarboxylate transporter receptor subunit TctC